MIRACVLASSVTLLVVGAAACSSGDDTGPDQGASGPAVDVRVELEQVWASEPVTTYAEPSDLRTVRLTDSLLLVGGEIVEADYHQVVAYDAATGERRWDARAVDARSDLDLRGYSFEATEELVLLPAASGRGSSHGPAREGVVALSAGDGSEVWRRLSPVSDPDRTTVTVVGASEEVAVARVETPGGVRTVGLSLEDGSGVWRADDLWAVSVTGDAVVAHTSPIAYRPGQVGSTEAPLAVLDAGTGEERWHDGRRVSVTAVSGRWVGVQEGEHLAAYHLDDGTHVDEGGVWDLGVRPRSSSGVVPPTGTGLALAGRDADDTPGGEPVVWLADEAEEPRLVPAGDNFARGMMIRPLVHDLALGVLLPADEGDERGDALFDDRGTRVSEPLPGQLVAARGDRVVAVTGGPGGIDDGRAMFAPRRNTVWTLHG